MLKKQGYELIIAEKIDAARQIAEALSSNPEKRLYEKIPYFELNYKGKKIIVAAAVGHLYNLAEKVKNGWVYPTFFYEWKPSYEISKQAAFTKKYVDALKELSKEARSFVVATDNDTEGSLIGFNVLKFIFNQKDAKRMIFSTLTKEELIESYGKANPHLDFPQIESGEARHELDWIWGMNSSRALTLAIKNAKAGFKILSSGRVQSPTLALLAEREKEIEKFKPKPYWQIFALINAKNKDLLTLHKKGKFWDEKEAEQTLEKCKNKDAIVSKVQTQKHYTSQPTPFNITTLQTESYKLFGFTPKQTLDIAESLYLQANISYPRTSSERLDPRINYKSILTAISKIEPLANKILSKKVLKPKEGKKTDPAHIAIYPTAKIPQKLNAYQQKIYSLIVKRFLSVFADPALRETMEVNFDINKEIFFIKGSRTLQPGWIEFYEPYAKFQEITLPDLKENEIYKVKKLELKKDETKPPKRYSAGSVISEMEKHGLGTRATRSQILQTLYDRGYIKDKSVVVTELGKKLIEVLKKYVPQLTSDKLTRYFEQQMDLIQQKKKQKEQILDEAKKVLTKILGDFKKKEIEIGKELSKATIETRNQESILGKCPNCNGQLRILYSRKTKKKFVACNQYPKCKTTFSLPQGKIQPTEKICQYCKTPIIKVIRAGKRPFEMCLTYDCKSKESWNKKNKKES